MAPPRKPRRLSRGESALWAKVAKSVRPLPGITPPEDDASAAEPAPLPAKARPTPPLKSASAPKKQTPSRPASRLDAGDPQLAKRVARGRLPLGATLDLHGMTQIEAERRLHGFLSFAAARGERAVLVITGKGARAPERIPFDIAPRGILRQRFLEWIDSPALANLVTQVRPAHQRHGGSGAFYVFLKRRGE